LEEEHQIGEYKFTIRSLNWGEKNDCISAADRMNPITLMMETDQGIYRHQLLKRALVKMTKVSEDIPVTDENLRKLPMAVGDEIYIVAARMNMLSEQDRKNF